MDTKTKKNPPKHQFRLTEMVELIDDLARVDRTAGVLVYIPGLVRAWPYGVADAHKTLFAAHRAGLLELRPDSGVGLLSKEDKALCPRMQVGPRSALTYVRLL